ncbi:molybdopterin-synthase adenylyltransferase MoeB [Roseivirga echinicomitans]|uniref:Molybdopterin-synthase adenylyltransferase n=1 Tax=Roseivirga echinicomitans TaxID=296218 RepID=A0A150XUG9_9BACT|nr:molybdopterin-synthase adenylyltransferase MoeB [Roseivirga echinicomitans]KYG82324.1 molybdenum cofactor biosynthesis protein MoeB [Roseivirga echinicomitans]
MLNKEELIRYNRQIILPDFGIEGQEKLKSSSVLVIGAGGLGIPNLSYLAAAGVGRIGLVEFDEISLSNLQRQVMYKTKQAGESKGKSAVKVIQELNPNVKVEHFETRLDAENALAIIRDFDLVVDGSDNLPTRYLVNDACVLLGKPLVYAAVFRYEGQVSVFNAQRKDGSRGPNYRDLFPTPPPPEMVPSCNEGGVFGALTGIIGAMQANEAIKLLTGLGIRLDGRLFLFDSQYFTTRFLNIKSNPENPLSGENPTITKLIDYEAFCGLSEAKNEADEITVQELHQLIESGNAPFILDVREPYEYVISNLKGLNIPLFELRAEFGRLSQNETIVIHCKSGQRSRKALELLKKEGFLKLRHLKGGILAWQKEIDNSMEIY